VPDKSRHVSSAEVQLFCSIQGKKHVQFKGVKLMKTPGYILTQQGGVAVTNDLYTVGGSNIGRTNFDPRCAHASAHSHQAHTETVIYYDHKRLFSNPDSFAIHEGTVCHIQRRMNYTVDIVSLSGIRTTQSITSGPVNVIK
jgi:hypothetical protein